MSTSAKIKLKVGSLELEYEGDPAFLTEGLESLLVTMTELSRVAPSIALDEQASSAESSPSNGSGILSVSTNTIAAHNDAKTGPELILCAAAQLTIVQGKQSLLRAEILKEMQTATGYYTSNIGSNYSAYLANLVKNKKINDLGGGKYALTATERKNFEAVIADIE